ncbi:MAG: type II secretion system protein GspM [Burkholderiaceae bacterium]|nr:type II secretion system protein GspM [Burkholderiaceae bacterium]
MSVASERLQRLRLRWSAYWEARSTRERLILAAGATVVILGILYPLLIDSALSGRERMEQRLPQLRQQAALMQGMAREVTALSGKAAPAATLTKQDIEATLAGKALRAQSVAVASDTVRLQLSSASYPALLGWLEQMQKSSQLTVIEAKVVALEQPGMVDVTLTLRQPKGE